MARPRATISVWFVVTRAWLLLLVFKSAKKLGVVKKPTRGVLNTRSAPARNEGRAKMRVVVSEAEGCRTVTICHCCFFFQAEDGIRDLTVTGVQTCALPI